MNSDLTKAEVPIETIDQDQAIGAFLAKLEIYLAKLEIYIEEQDENIRPMLHDALEEFELCVDEIIHPEDYEDEDEPYEPDYDEDEAPLGCLSKHAAGALLGIAGLLGVGFGIHEGIWLIFIACWTLL